MAIRAIRGATTVPENTKEAIFDATQEVIRGIMSRNSIEADDIASLIFTVTPDLTAVFPAAAIRDMGICNIPLLDMAAPDIDGAMKMCIRVMVHINTNKTNDELNHVYLRGAAALRPDLTKKKISVAIDGPAGAGKSSVAKEVAKRLGYVYIDTGAMYRTVAVYAIENGIGFEDKELVSELDNIDIKLKHDGKMQRMYLNGKDVSERIRENDASMGASAVAKVAQVRRRLVAMQQEMGKDGGVIMDGRDIGTTVLPNAELKIYLTASVDERAMRRYKEYIEKGIECDLEAIKADVIQRDENDMNRAVSPLKMADDAIYADTTHKSFDEAVSYIEKLVKEKEVSD